MPCFGMTAGNLRDFQNCFTMSVQEQIKNYIAGLPEAKRNDLQVLHRHMLTAFPKKKLWFLDGKDSNGKIVSNPSIGYGAYTIMYADKTSKAFYQVGLSANSSGISVYIMGIKDKTYLARAYKEKLGKANITGYCIRFKTLKDINMDILEEAIRYRFEMQDVKPG